MNIVILNECFISEDQIVELQKNHEVTVYEVTATVDDAIERIRDAEIIFTDQFVCPLTNEVLDQAKNLKLIILNSTSYHILDAEYLKSRNIHLCNTIGYSSESVAELVFTYILLLMRNVLVAYRDNSHEPFEILPDDMSHRKYLGNNLNEKNIGIIGLWNIGQKVSSIAEGFNMNILAYNKSVKNIWWVEWVSLDELLIQSDIVVIAVPYSDDTHHLVNEERMKLMKKWAIIINISSEKVLDEDVLIEKLKNKDIAWYGIDDYKNKDKSHYFYNSDNVIILPHLWFFSEESLSMIGTRMMEWYRGFIEWKDAHRVI